MTILDGATTPPSRPRTLQAELLADLREAAPMPTVRADGGGQTSSPERPGPPERGTPTVDVRVTPGQWSVPGIRVGSTGTGVVLTAGPVRISLTGFHR